jgi:SAM-dependent methyltransferase
MSEFAEHNRRAWNEVHRRRHASHGQSLGLDASTLDNLEPLADLKVLHLQCATGETSARLVARGSVVTGVDIADEAVAVAAEAVPDATFVTADVHELPASLRHGRFDLVLTEGGVLVWLHDLDAWATGIADALRPGGRFFLSEEHPVAMCVDAEGRWVDDYFDESTSADVGWGHFELIGEPATEPKYERLWRLGQVVTALAQAGLRIETLDERPGNWRGTAARVPGSFTLLASKGA